MATARVLVVDDEPVVRDLTARVLSKFGYQVMAASDGEQALKIIHSPTTVDLVLSDVVMPGIHGPELVEAARKVLPSTAFVLMSAYSPGVLPGGVSFLSKPFSSKTLIAAVERALAEAAEAQEALIAAKRLGQELRGESERLRLELREAVREAEETQRRSKEILRSHTPDGQNPADGDPGSKG